MFGAANALAQADGPVTGPAINGDLLTEDSCEVLATSQGKSPELREVPGMHVLDRTEKNPFVVDSTPDVLISGVMCWRSEARLAPNDYLVGHKTGHHLYIKTDTGNEATDRTIALERVSGSFRVRLLSGPEWTKAEEEEMKTAIKLYIERTASS